jgi:ribosomal protein L40E
MRAVRCDVCGAKAMIAAAKCPSCGHLFELRDGFGELLPLSYCSTCESYYPETAGSCRWCGTQPERPPIDGKIWRGIGLGAAAIVGGIFLVQNGASKGAPPRKPKPASAVAAKAVPPASALDTDIAMARAVAAANDSLASRAISDSVPTASPATAPTTVAAGANVKTEATPTVIDPAATKGAVPKPVTAVASSGGTQASHATKRPASRWVRSVSRHWVIVRSGASKESRIVASIGPNSRVELGESRGDWRRIRTKGITGWVEPRSSFEVVATR